MKFAGFDKSAVPDTGLQSLDEALWKSLVSIHGAAAPEVALEKMGLLTRDERGTPRASVAGLLLCARAPEEWLDNACITATCYRGADRASMQIDAKTICGPLDKQIAAAVAFVLCNMRVAARKEPGRVDLPQFSDRAVFEAVVNAVAHRDYSIRGRRIRLSLFEDRLEIQSPGPLANGLRVAFMDAQQATRNEVLASTLGRMSSQKVRGSGDSQFFMERRGDGVGIIRHQTEALGAEPPFYELIGETDLRLTIPAAPLAWTPGRVAFCVQSAGRPIAEAAILLHFPDGAYEQASSNIEGAATMNLHSTHLPMTLFVAATGFEAYVRQKWVPATDDRRLDIDLQRLAEGGSVILADGVGEVPGLLATLNPVRDVHDRTSLHVSGATIDQGIEQPAAFLLGQDLLLTDSASANMTIRVAAVVGKSALVEYRQ